MSIKKKLIMTMGGTAIAASLVTGGTYALFSANAVNAGNTFTAGTVKLADFTGHTVASSMQFFNNLAPGDQDTKTITIKNTGSLDAWVKVNDAATQATRSGDLFNGATPLQISYSSTPVKVSAGQTVNLNVSYVFPLAADDSYQSATGSINIVVDAVQVRNNDVNNAPVNFPSQQTFITPQDFNVNSGWTFFANGQRHNGYSLGFKLAETTVEAGVNSIKADLYKNNTLLQTITAGSTALSYNEGTQLSIPYASSLKNYNSGWWNYSNWYGAPADKPTKVVFTITTNDGHTYTATKNSY